MNKQFEELRSINVNEYVEKKEGLSYLTWSIAWDIFKKKCPDANYEIVKNEYGLPYFESPSGVMCYTKVTSLGITHEMWLPVMDSKNKSMKSESYTYKTKFGDKSVDAFSMFDVNKTIMRCLVKNLAMFGLGLYIYSGEDLPSDEEHGSNKEQEKPQLKKEIKHVSNNEKTGAYNSFNQTKVGMNNGNRNKNEL